MTRFYVMSAEETDGINRPFLHAVCATEEEARRAVAKVVSDLDLKDEEGDPLQPGTNDGDKWADERYDSDGLVAWNAAPERNMTVMAKRYDDADLEVKDETLQDQ